MNNLSLLFLAILSTSPARADDIGITTNPSIDSLSRWAFEMGVGSVANETFGAEPQQLGAAASFAAPYRLNERITLIPQVSFNGYNGSGTNYSLSGLLRASTSDQKKVGFFLQLGLGPTLAVNRAETRAGAHSNVGAGAIYNASKNFGVVLQIGSQLGTQTTRSMLVPYGLGGVSRIADVTMAFYTTIGLRAAIL